jgi:uncharacterized protein
MGFRFTLIFVLALFAGRPGVADELTPQKRSDIVRLLQITGAENVSEQFSSTILHQMFASLKAARPDIPDRAYKVMEREISSILSEHVSTPGGLLDQVIFVYDKYYTDQEIRELLTFYSSPIGKKVVSTMPTVLNESIMAGQRWEESIAPEIKTRLIDSLRREGLLAASQ